MWFPLGHCSLKHKLFPLLVYKQNDFMQSEEEEKWMINEIDVQTFWEWFSF